MPADTPDTPDAPAFTPSNYGKTVRIHYRGFLDDGSPLPSSRDGDGEPLEFTCGEGLMLPAFDAAVADMRPGEKKTLRVPAAEAYGERRDDLVVRFPADQVPGFSQLHIGDRMALASASGESIPARVVALEPDAVTVDANPVLAGQDLNFEIELLEVLP